MIIPTQKHTTETPSGQTSKATKPRKAVKAIADADMHITGILEHMAKKKYDP